MVNLALIPFLVLPSLAFADSGGVNVAKNMSDLFMVAAQAGIMIGFFLFGVGIYMVYSSQKSGSANDGLRKPFLYILTGTIMISSGWAYELFKNSFIGEGSGVSMESGQMHLALDAEAARIGAGIDNTGVLTGLIPASSINALIAFVFLIGFIFFLVGLSKIRDIGDSRKESNLMSPLMNIVGGMICMNITWFGCFAGSIFGVSAFCI